MNNKNKEPVRDSFGRIIKVGDLIIYGKNYYSCILGQITRLSSKSNNLFCTFHIKDDYNKSSFYNTIIKLSILTVIVNEFQTNNFYKDKINAIINETKIPLNSSDYSIDLESIKPIKTKIELFNEF